MTKKITILLLILIIAVFTYSFLEMPKKFETEGGSCYQGITAMIIRFFLTVCTFINLLAIFLFYYKSKIETAKVLNIISLIIWSTGTFIHSNENIQIGIRYFTPFIMLNLIILFLFTKWKHNLKKT